MTDLRQLAMGIFKIRQAMDPKDVTCQNLVNTSVGFAEASVENDPGRNELLAEFYRIVAKGS